MVPRRPKQQTHPRKGLQGYSIRFDMKDNEQFNLIKELADMHNKAMDRHVISLVKIPPRKKKEDDKVVNK
jgi:hypothetical protein